MFDYHIHTTVSFDGKSTPQQVIAAAKAAGLKEICFTDHIDYQADPADLSMVFRTEDYNAAYDCLEDDTLKIRRGLEFGLWPDNQSQFRRDLQRRPFDFVLGSVHFTDSIDVYEPEYWQGKTVEEAYRRYLEHTLTCVRAHSDFDVLAHLTYICKAHANPTHAPIYCNDFRDITDEILKELVRKGKGLEMNTSGVDRCGDFLPPADFFRRFKELGGEIVTVGSDAHTPDRVGQYTDRACGILGEIFGYVCTFENRHPIFHKI